MNSLTIKIPDIIPSAIPEIIDIGTDISEVNSNLSPEYIPKNEVKSTITYISSTEAPAIII